MSKSNTTANPTVRELEKLRARVTGLEVARRQAEEALRESEKKFSNIYEQAPIGIELYDEKGRLLDVNPACLQIFGVNDVSEVQGFNLFADPNITNEIREMLAQGEPATFESAFDFELVKKLGLYKTSRSGQCFLDWQITPLKSSGTSITGYMVRVREITERKKMAHALEQSEKRFRALIEHSTDAITLIDRHGMVVYESPSAQLLTGYIAEERNGRSGFELIHPDDLPAVKATLSDVLTHTGSINNAQFRSVKKDGTVWWTEGTAINLLHEPAVQAIVINYRDITERKTAEQALRDANDQLNVRVAEIEKLQAELREQALRDPLTGLYNRRYLGDALERELSRVKREKKSMSIIVMDIDHFKRINDSYGHQAGDQFLTAIADLIARHARSSDIACRYGGEEFLLVMPGAGVRTAARRAEELRVACMQISIPHGGKKLNVTVSLGVAAYPLHGKEAEEVVIKADKALYKSKRSGRNRVTVWSESPDSASSRRRS